MDAWERQAYKRTIEVLPAKIDRLHILIKAMHDRNPRFYREAESSVITDETSYSGLAKALTRYRNNLLDTLDLASSTLQGGL